MSKKRYAKNKKPTPPKPTAPNVHIHHPQGTMHRLPRSWLEENATIELKPGAPEVAVKMWDVLKGIAPESPDGELWEVHASVSKSPALGIKLVSDFLGRFGEHAMFVCEHGNYNYKDCLKMMEVQDE